MNLYLKLDSSCIKIWIQIWIQNYLNINLNANFESEFEFLIWIWISNLNLERDVIEPGFELVGSQARTLFCQSSITHNPHSGSQAWNFLKNAEILFLVAQNKKSLIITASSGLI